MKRDQCMCRGCPFRTPGETRGALILRILDNPDQTWPCHESEDQLWSDCEGRRLFAAKVRQILDEPAVNTEPSECAECGLLHGYHDWRCSLNMLTHLADGPA